MRTISSTPRVEVLRYSPKSASRATVRRHYARWRHDQGVPPRCDIEQCAFYSQPLVWLGQPLPLILDHINGNNLDNRAANLRYICPNCDSQLSTRGGKNRGRVHEARDGGYVLLSRDGRRHYHLLQDAGELRLTGYAPNLKVSRAAEK